MINDPSQITNQVISHLPGIRNPYYFARNVLTTYECQNLWKTYWESDHIFKEDVNDECSPWYKYFREKRARQHMFLDESIPWIDDVIDFHAKKANSENFYLDISFGLMSKQLIKYSVSDWFDKHIVVMTLDDDTKKEKQIKTLLKERLTKDLSKSQYNLQ